LSILNVPIKTFQSFYNETYTNRTGEYMSDLTWTSLWSLTNALNPAGGIIGGLLSATVADYFGRKRALLFINIFTLISGILGVISKYLKSYESLIASRFFSGLLSGLFMGVAPLYLSEIPPKNLRGKSGALNQFIMSVGILAANIAGLPQLLGTAALWPILLGIQFIPMIVHLIGLPFTSETPKYIYVYKKNPEKAREILEKLRIKDTNVDSELNEYENEIENQKEKCTYLDLIRKPILRKALLMAVVAHAIQQLSGINAVGAYSTQIFISIGLDAKTSAVYATVILGVVQMIMSFITLILVEKTGRRSLLVIGTWGMCVTCFVLAAARIFTYKLPFLRYISALSVVVYRIFFSVGPGPIPWLLTGELFKSDARAKASSIAVFVNFLLNFIVCLLFPHMETFLGNYSFIVFGCFLILLGSYISIKMPETKNLTIDEIMEKLK
jgi:MFS transporter, SP family, solute carrier family 2 (facilitated glucose transporter), member 1